MLLVGIAGLLALLTSACSAMQGRQGAPTDATITPTVTVFTVSPINTPVVVLPSTTAVPVLSTTTPKTIMLTATTTRVSPLFPTRTPVTLPLPAALPGRGTVTGQICYPSEYIPAMNLYFENIARQEAVTVPIVSGQHYYTVTLPSGTYHAYAWLPGFGGMGGGFTSCKPSGPCKDHTLQPVIVISGQVMGGVDICDWYSPYGAIPLPPDIKLVGAMEGMIFYPGAGMPAMKVYARNVETGETFSVTTKSGQYTFRFENLPVGGYYVFAWYEDDIGRRLGGSYACLLSRTCADHGLLTVGVNYNRTTTGIKINDWFDLGSVPQP
jgi:hypothetical protein